MAGSRWKRGRACGDWACGCRCTGKRFTEHGSVRRTGAETWHLREKLLIPYQGKIRGISMVDTKKEAEWKMTEEGIQVVIPQEYREGETPIAIVWKIEQ